jgi:hypothetical protein
MAISWERMAPGAAAGAIAAAVWALQQPLDKRVLGYGYDDVELLGRMAVREAACDEDDACGGASADGPWYPVGFAMHVANGTLFGAVYAGVLVPGPLARVPAPLRGPLVAEVENFALWPLGRLSDHLHPARERLPRLTGSRRALAQATWRHLLFGVVLGELERRWNRSG